MPDLASALIYYVVFLFSTTLHEAAHAWAAMRGGDLTAYHGGQVSLDPRPHIKREPIGMVVLPLISVLASGWPLGFASAPYDPEWALRHPRRAGWMALAGPGANLLLVLITGVAVRIGLVAGVFASPEQVTFGHIVRAANPASPWEAVAVVASVFFSLNLLLAIFNLFPLPPLDGSGAVTLFLNEDQARRYQTAMFRAGYLRLLGLFIVWQIFNPIFHPVWLFAVNLIHIAAQYG
jgi:Zn-dependent protease